MTVVGQIMTDYDRLCKSVNPQNSHTGLALEASNIRGVATIYAPMHVHT